MDIMALITKGFDVISTLGSGVITLLGKGKLDETEIAKMKLDIERMMQQNEFLKVQLGIAVQQQLISMEQATGAKWRTPLILISGCGLIMASLNNILASCYILWARPVDMTSSALTVLAGMFLLLSIGDPKILMAVFHKVKDTKNNIVARVNNHLKGN